MFFLFYFFYFPLICSVFGWKPVLWLLQRHGDKPSHAHRSFHLTLWGDDSCEERLQWISSLALSLSYLSLLCLYLLSSSPLSPLPKRLSSAMRWRSYRPLAARLLNCRQLWDERVSVKLSIAASAGPNALKWGGWFVLAGHRCPREIRHKLFCVSQMSSWGLGVAVYTNRYNVVESERRRPAYRIMTTTGIHAGFHSSCEVVADAPHEGSSQQRITRRSIFCLSHGSSFPMDSVMVLKWQVCGSRYEDASVEGGIWNHVPDRDDKKKKVV